MSSHVTKIEEHRNPAGALVSIEVSCSCGWNQMLIFQSAAAAELADVQAVGVLAEAGIAVPDARRRMQVIADAHRAARAVAEL